MGSKILHIGISSQSRIQSKGISLASAVSTYRGLVLIALSSSGTRNFSQCDSLLIGTLAGANTYPNFTLRRPSIRLEHEASTSKLASDTLFFFQQRGVNTEAALDLMI